MAYADGDARKLLNTLETLAMAATQEKLQEITDAWLLVLGESARAAMTRVVSSSTTPSARAAWAGARL